MTKEVIAKMASGRSLNMSDNRVKKSGIVYIIRIHAQLLILAAAYFIAAGSLSIRRAWIYFGIAAVTYLSLIHI